MVFRSLEDLQKLVTEQVQEKDTIEYKRDMYGNSDSDKREMLKDITSLANHHGGYLLIGIDENEEGIPTNIVGIEPNNDVERITSCCLNSIDKRVIGLDVKDISTGNGRVVIVMSIPESINAPHMVTHSGLYQFWKRHGRQKDRMTIDEIGEAFDRRLSNRNRLERFQFTRNAEILEDIGEKSFMIISAAQAYLRDEVILNSRDETLRNLILNPPRLQQVNMGISSGSPYVTINGLRADGRTPFYSGDRSVEMYIEVFSNGYIEFGRLLTSEKQYGVVLRSLVEPPLIVDFIAFVQKVYEQYLPLTPIVLSLSILNAKGMWLAIHYVSEDIREKWQKQHIELKPIYVDDISKQGKSLTREICDRLWQCFHREKCNLFADDGTFRPSR
jgi:hypothetical protein